MKIKRILENRSFIYRKKDIFKFFKKKLVDALYLEREIFSRKFGKREQYQARVEYLVFLVSCVEHFLEELFKLSIDNGVITLEDITKQKNLNDLKFSLKELKQINENKIKISEILAEEMNFQNIKEIIFFCDLLKMTQNFKKIKHRKLEFLELNKIMKKPVKELSPSAKKRLTYFILSGFFEITCKPKDEESLIKVINTLQRMILLRHKIVHKAYLTKIENWESLAYTMAATQIAYLTYESYKIELKKKDERKNDLTKS